MTTGTTRVTTAAEVLATGPVVALTPAERARVDALRRPVDRDAFVAARVLARVLVAAHLGLDPAEVAFGQVCEHCGGPHGRPRVLGHDGVHVSWAHSDELVAATVDTVRCAVDVESVSRLRPGELPLGVLTAGERSWLEEQPDRPHAFAALWVRKEVLVKLGAVSLDEAADVDVTPALAGQLVLGRTIEAVEVASYDVVAARGS